MKHWLRGNCIRELNCNHFSWWRPHYWVLCPLIFCLNRRKWLVNWLFFIWTLRMIYVDFSINSCHLWCTIMCRVIPVHFLSVFFTLFSRLCYFRFWNSIINRTLGIFKCDCDSIAIIVIAFVRFPNIILILLLFFIWIILRL